MFFGSVERSHESRMLQGSRSYLSAWSPWQQCDLTRVHLFEMQSLNLAPSLLEPAGSWARGTRVSVALSLRLLGAAGSMSSYELDTRGQPGHACWPPCPYSFTCQKAGVMLTLLYPSPSFPRSPCCSPIHPSRPCRGVQLRQCYACWCFGRLTFCRFCRPCPLCAPSS